MEMRDFRCIDCDRLLARHFSNGGLQRLQVKCPRCGTLNDTGDPEQGIRRAYRVQLDRTLPMTHR